MTANKALRLALEALEHFGEAGTEERYRKSTAAIKAALEAKDEPWSPVSIGVDVTKDGAHVVGIYALDADTSQIFYAKHHPVPQRTWVGLTDEVKQEWIDAMPNPPQSRHFMVLVNAIESELKDKNA